MNKTYSATDEPANEGEEDLKIKQDYTREMLSSTSKTSHLLESPGEELLIGPGRELWSQET